MTVKELEKVSAPPKTGEDAREERARLLEAAALEIEVRGWAQGEQSDSEGPVCAAASIFAALGYNPWGDEHCYQEYEAIWGGDLWSMPSGDSRPLPHWNDKPGRTAEEVTFLLRWRAEEIRDGR